MNRRTPQRYWKLGTWLATISAVGFLAVGWVAPASAQIVTAFDLTGLGTRNPVEIALSLINWMLGILALLAVVLLMYGGFLWLTSRGEEEQIEKAKRVLINVGIGLLIILAAWGIVLYILLILLGATGAGNTNDSGCVGDACGYDEGFPPSGSTFYVRNTDPGEGDVGVTLCTDIYHLFSKDLDTSTVITSVNRSDNPTFYLRLVDSILYTSKAAGGEACSANVDCASALCSTSTLTCTGDNVAGTIEIDSLDAGEFTDHFSFLPEANFEVGATYQGTVIGGDVGVHSTAETGALTMDQDYSYKFVTGDTTDTIPPTVKEVSGNSPFPEYQATDVCLNTPINFEFSEPIRTYTVDDDTDFLISNDATFATPVSLRAFSFGGDRVYAETRPSSALNVNSLYYAELFGGTVDAEGTFTNVITDACGNPLDGNYSKASDGAPTDNYFSPGYDYTKDGAADDPLRWTTGENAICVPVIEAIAPTHEYYGYGDDLSTEIDDSDATSVAITGEYLSPNPEIIFNDTIYSSSSDLTCFDQNIPPDSAALCLIRASTSEDDTKVAVGAQDGNLAVKVVGETSTCLFDADSDGTTSCEFTVDSPFIDYINPHDSAPGDYVTLGGEKFGTTAGSVYFRADDATVAAGYPAYVIADLPDACGDTWSDTQIVVVVPDEYPVGTNLDVQLQTADGHWSNFTYFTISDTDRPSLCQMVPECNDAGAQTSTLTGRKLGTSGIVYYGTGVGTSSSWSSDSIRATSPGDITDGSYYVTVKVGGVSSNGLEYNIPCPVPDSTDTDPGHSSFYVVATDPTDKEADVTLCTDVYVQMSSEINTSTLSLSTARLEVAGGAGGGSSCTQNNECASALCSEGTCSGDAVLGSIELDASAATQGTEHFSFLPATDFESNTTYIGIITGGSSGLKASDGTAMDDGGYSFIFTTGTTTDITPPQVAETSSSPYPADGQTDICLNTVISVDFTEAMRTYTFDDSASFLLSNDSTFGAGAPDYLINLHSFAFGATRETASTRPLSTLSAFTPYFLRLYGGDLQADGSLTNVVTDACGNPLDGDYDGTAEAAHVDDYLSSSDVDQPVNWETGEDPDCFPVIQSITPTSQYYGVVGATSDYLTITGSDLWPAPTVNFYNTVFSQAGLPACLDPVTSFPPPITATCFDEASSNSGTIVTKIPVGAVDGSLSVQVGGVYSTCSFDADSDGSTSCEVTVNSPHIDSVSPSDAAAGDYITIHGTNFGKGGIVFFVDSKENAVEAEFPPESCGSTWSDTQIVVVVPDDYPVGTLLSIQVETDIAAGGYFSNRQAFTVSDANRPSVCSITPDCHESGGHTSTVRGKKFGSTGKVKYGTNTGTSGAWSENEIEATAPVSLAQDIYQVDVTVDEEISNSVNYSIPCGGAPEVVEDATCSISSSPKIFPLPNPQPNEDQACVNSDVEVMFNQVMDDSTFTPSNLKLEKCKLDDGTGTFLDSGCGTPNLILVGDIQTGQSVTSGSETYYGFIVNPSSLEANTWYKMTVDTGVLSAAGISLTKDYTFHFKVRDSSEPCALSSISIEPSTITHNAFCRDLNEDGDTADEGECPRTDGNYTGQVHSSECLLLDSSVYSWDWSLTNPTGAVGGCTDTDDDGLADSDETVRTTDPTKKDSDSDTYEDGWEVREGTDPLLAESMPTAVGFLNASDICEDTQTCVVDAAGVGTCTSVVGDFSSSGGNSTTASGTSVTVYPGGNDNYNQGTASLVAQANSITDSGEYKVDFGYCEEDRDCELSCAGSTCDETKNRCTPVISDFSPASGELGTWVTLNGCMFGSKKGNVQWEDVVNDGSVTAIDTEWPDVGMCGDTWTDTQIVAQFPATYTPLEATAAIPVPTSSYAANVITTYSLEDTTTDEYQVNSDVHAGLCRVYPDSQVIGDTTTLFGRDFGEAEGGVSFNSSPSSTVIASRVTADPEFTAWSDTLIETTVPQNAYSGFSSAGAQGVKVVLNDGVSESTAKDFTVTYENPTIVSQTPEDGETDVCPNGAINAVFSEAMTGFSLGTEGTVRLYTVTTNDSGEEEFVLTPLQPLSFSGNGVTLSPSESLDFSTVYQLEFVSDDSTQIRSTVSGLNLDGGTTDFRFTTGAVTCTPDHVSLTTTANELIENLDLDGNGVIENTDISVESWTYTQASESRQWDAHMYDVDNKELANVSNLAWTWTWQPVYNEAACTNALWVSSVAGDSDLDLLADSLEVNLDTEPTVYDTDGDGFGDGWERLIGTDPLDVASYPNALDTDGDGLLATEEIDYNTSYTSYDTDGDGFGDGWEVLNSSNPVDASSFPTVADPGPDSDQDGLLEVTTADGAQEETDAGLAAADNDGDGFTDIWEQEIGTDPLDAGSYPNAPDIDADGLIVTEEADYNTDYTVFDTDGDGSGDGWEVARGTDPTDATSIPSSADPRITATASDLDSDGYLDAWEEIFGTDPDDPDSEGSILIYGPDSTSDGSSGGTNPTDSDSDGDGYLDGWEILFSSDPLDSASIPAIYDPGTDADGDGLGSILETANATDPNDYDSDADGYSDGWEVENSTDPNDAASYPTKAETITGIEESQMVVAGTEDNATDSVVVKADALRGWTGSLSASDAANVHFCDGDSWQYSDTNQRMLLWFCDADHSLPSLAGPAVTAGSSSTDYIRQYLFPSDTDANDTIGIRVYPNGSDFLTPEEWVNQNVPNAGDLSLSSTEIDGYPAVQSSNAVYVNASFVAKSSSNYKLYNNIYLITWTQGGDAETIAKKLLEAWQFNSNVNDSAVSDTISGPEQGCVYSAKSKLERDTERMIELNTLSNTLESYYTDHSSQYPFPKSDSLDSYLQNITNSIWPSWQGALGNVLGQAIGEDPINKFIDGVDSDGNTIVDYLNAEAKTQCPYSPDTNQFFDSSGTCWDNVNLTFTCPDNSSVYLYKVDDTDQKNSWVYGNMEYTLPPGAPTIYYPAAGFNTYQTSEVDYDPCASAGQSCSCFNFSLNSTAGAAFTGGE